MPNDIINIRFMDKHFQWEKRTWKPSIKHNSHWEDGHWKSAGLITIYTFLWYHR